MVYIKMLPMQKIWVYYHTKIIISRIAIIFLLMNFFIIKIKEFWYLILTIREMKMILVLTLKYILVILLIKEEKKLKISYYIMINYLNLIIDILFLIIFFY